jgi:hypothetical protein
VKAFEIFLFFVTLWVLIIAGVVYLTHRRRPSIRGGGLGVQGCCLEVPCSAACARAHQELRDRDTLEYHKIVRELGHIVQAGLELEPPQAPSLVTPPAQWAEDQAS